MRVLGVDPGSLDTGWGVVEGPSARPRVVGSGVLSLPRGEPFPARLHRLQEEFERLLEQTAPEEAAVESPFHGANARSALQLAHARGVILAVLGGMGIPVVEYAPAMVKKSVTGNGRAEKLQVRTMVSRLLGLEAEPAAKFDRSDALAVALCHLASATHRDAIRRSGYHARKPSRGRR